MVPSLLTTAVPFVALAVNVAVSPSISSKVGEITTLPSSITVAVDTTSIVGASLVPVTLSVNVAVVLFPAASVTV